MKLFSLFIIHILISIFYFILWLIIFNIFISGILQRRKQFLNNFCRNSWSQEFVHEKFSRIYKVIFFMYQIFTSILIQKLNQDYEVPFFLILLKMRLSFTKLFRIFVTIIKWYITFLEDYNSFSPNLVEKCYVSKNFGIK